MLCVIIFKEWIWDGMKADTQEKWWVYQFPVAALSSDHKVGDLTQQKWILSPV